MHMSPEDDAVPCGIDVVNFNIMGFGINYLVTPSATTASVVASAVVPLVDSVDLRRSAFLSTVLTRDSTLPNPFFSLSFGTGGPVCAGELMAAVGVV